MDPPPPVRPAWLQLLGVWGCGLSIFAGTCWLPANKGVREKSRCPPQRAVAKGPSLALLPVVIAGWQVVASPLTVQCLLHPHTLGTGLVQAVVLPAYLGPISWGLRPVGALSLRWGCSTASDGCTFKSLAAVSGFPISVLLDSFTFTPLILPSQM